MHFQLFNKWLFILRIPVKYKVKYYCISDVEWVFYPIYYLKSSFSYLVKTTNKVFNFNSHTIYYIDCKYYILKKVCVRISV